jgi:branched-chain amino acid transport system substrate-binding protein
MGAAGTQHWSLGIGFMGLLSLVELEGCSPAEGESPTRIPIGFVATDLTAPNSQQRIDQLSIVLSDINAQGGVELADGRHELELVVASHRQTTEGAIQAMEELKNKGVTAIVDPPWSSMILGESGDGSDGAAAAAKRLDMLVVTGSATSPLIRDVDDDDLVWRTTPDDTVQGSVAANSMIDRGIKTAAVAYRDDAWGQGLFEVFQAKFLEAGGSVLSAQKIPTDSAGTLDFSDELEALFADKPDAVYFIAMDEVSDIALQIDAGSYLDAYEGERPLFFGSDGFYGEDLLTNAPASFLSGLVGLVTGADRESDSYQALATLMQKEGYDASADLETSRVDALSLIVLAMQAAGSTDAHQMKKFLPDLSRLDEGEEVVKFGEWAKARKALRSGASLGFDGVTGEIAFDEFGDRTKGTLLRWSIEKVGDSFQFAAPVNVDYSLEP